jgi:predicted RNA methylase
MSSKDIKTIRKQGLDKFYTDPEYALKCIHKVYEIYGNKEWNLIVEPSAGNGSFFMRIPDNINKIGIDISPEHDSILEMDFFDYYPPKDLTNILVIGNPPFGRVCSTAIKFFNHASQWSNVIAFIIPRTFKKLSVQNKLDNRFHLVYEEDTPVKPCQFSPAMSVKCCFQIWQKKDHIRPLIKLPVKHIDWKFIPFGPKDNKGQPTPPKNIDFAIRAYGGNIGEIKTDEEDLESLRPKSWHWIKSNIDKNILIERFKSLNYSNSVNTARQNSIGKAELIQLYSEKYN